MTIAVIGVEMAGAAATNALSMAGAQQTLLLSGVAAAQEVRTHG